VRVGLVTENRAGEPEGARLMAVEQSLERRGIVLGNQPAKFFI